MKSILFLLCLNLLEFVQSCTVFIVGKDASKDGSVLVSHSNDGEFETDPRLVKVPAQDFPSNSTRPVFYSPENYPRYVGYDRGVPEYYPNSSSSAMSIFSPIGHIPQVSHTFAYLEETYGAVNEHQLGIGESTCSGVFGASPLGSPNGTALFSIDELTHIAMERTKTAREAIALMGSLAERYGFYGAGQFEGTAESLAVSDVHEAWIFHILPDPTGTYELQTENVNFSFSLVLTRQQLTVISKINIRKKLHLGCPTSSRQRLCCVGKYVCHKRSGSSG